VSRTPWDRLLLDANRRVLATGVLVLVYAAVVVAGALDPVPLRLAVERSDPVETLFQALLTAVVTGVTLVVTVNQLVLSQELGPLGDQRERLAGATDVRRDAARVTDEAAAPADPATFLRRLVETAAARAETLAEAVDERDGTVEEFTRPLCADAETAAARLDDARFGSFETLRAALAFDYSRHLHAGRRLQGERGAALSPAASDALEDALEALSLFGAGREHVKTLYFQWELIQLSREVLYAAVPALVTSVVGIVVLADAGTVTGTLLGVGALVWVVGAGVAVALAPFALLFAHVLRIATVARRTLAVSPFDLRDG
jgi:hypothetical protein